jgi:hypothetical protein
LYLRRSRAIIASASLVRGLVGATVLGAFAAAVGLMRPPSKPQCKTNAELPAE